MITPDTIITAELLAGLDKCPFCGAGTLHSTRTEETLECGTYLRLGSRAEKNRGLGCYEQDNETLRARVKELENRCAQLGTEGDKLAAIVDRDYRGAAYTLAWNALGPKGKKP